MTWRVLSLLMIVSLGGCILSDDVDEFDFQLPEKVFELSVSDLGLSSATSLDCSAQAEVCGQVSSELTCDKAQGVCVLRDDASFPTVDCSSDEQVCSQFGEVVSCVEGRCVLKFDVARGADVDLAREVPELKDVGSSRLTKVTLGSLYADVQTNTLGIDLPPFSVYVADAGTTSLEFDGDGNPTTPGLTKIGVLPSIPAGATGRFDVELTSAGKEELTRRLETPDVPFALFVTAHIELGPGDPLPNLEAGGLRVVVSGTATASLSGF